MLYLPLKFVLPSQPPQLSRLLLEGTMLSGPVPPALAARALLYVDLSKNLALCGPLSRPQQAVPWATQYTRLGFPCV